MAPADAEGGGFEGVPDAGVKPKLPNGDEEEEFMLFALLSRAFGGKEEAVGEARSSCSSSSWTEFMAPARPGGGEVAPKGLLRWKVLSGLECC